VKRWRCADKRDAGKSIDKPETDLSWPFGYENFFEMGGRYRFRVRVESGYGAGAWSSWSTHSVYHYSTDFDYSFNKSSYTQEALDDASEWTLFRPHFGAE
jgi:hypothetical protein